MTNRLQENAERRGESGRWAQIVEETIILPYALVPRASSIFERARLSKSRTPGPGLRNRSVAECPLESEHTL